MNENLELLTKRVLEEPGVYDSPIVHHEFKNGGHGRKLDMENIKPGTDLFDDLITASAARVRSHLRMPEVIIGIANGGNPWGLALAEELGVEGLESEKDKKDRAVLPYASRLAMRRIKPDEVKIVDDLGTTGSSCKPLIEQLETNGMKSRHPVGRISVFYIVQRQLILPELDEIEISHNSLITLDLPTFKDAKACANDSEGFCANGVELEPHKK